MTETMNQNMLTLVSIMCNTLFLNMLIKRYKIILNAINMIITSVGLHIRIDGYHINSEHAGMIVRDKCAIIISIFVASYIYASISNIESDQYVHLVKIIQKSSMVKKMSADYHELLQNLEEGIVLVS